MLAKAALTARNLEGDVMWGTDNTFLLRAIEEIGEDGWLGYWSELDANGFEIVES